MKHAHVVLPCALLLCGLFSQAQQTVTTVSNAVVPPLVNFSGVLTDVNSKPLSGVVGVTFLLYKDAQGGAPLWMETQNVRPDKSGHYTAVLGSTSSHGLPADIFVAGEAHWLGVQVAGQDEQGRVLLVSAPYALKAGDAETLGGLPASAFVLALPANNSGSAAGSTAPPQSASPLATAITGTGTTGFLPLWDSTTDITSSVISQSGSGTTAKVGIGTTTPGATLDVRGSETVRGIFTLPAGGTATATKGSNSQPMTLASSVFNSSTGTAVPQTFQWQAEPVGNNTSTASGSLNLLYGPGTIKPVETGLSITSNGQITFAAGQTFPGTGPGTITGVTAGTDLTGGGTSGVITLNLDTTATNALYAQLNAVNTFAKQQNINASENVTASSTSEVLNVTETGAGATGDGIHGITIATGGTGVFGEGAIGIQGLANPSTGLSGLFRGTVKTTGNGNNMLAGDPGCGTGYAGLGFLTSGSLAGCLNYALIGGPKGDTYINSGGTATIHFRSNNNELVTIDNSGNVIVKGQNGGGNLTVDGTLTVSGKQTIKNTTVMSGANSSGVLQVTNTLTSGPAPAVVGTTDSSAAAGIKGVVAATTGTEAGVVGETSSLLGYGVSGSGPNVGVIGRSSGSSAIGGGLGNAGVWGDFGGGRGDGYGVMGTADANSAGVFLNKTCDNCNPATTSPTLYLANLDSSGIAFDGSLVFETYNPTYGLGCVIFISGEESCTAGFNTPSAVDNGARKVTTYSMQSPENWFEDFGSGSLVNGAAKVVLDPTYAQTVNTGAEYHVFLTPKGDSKGLYVSNETPQGFEVHEQQGGRSNVAFDYRIVAKRNGYEKIRLADVTAKYKRMESAQARRAPQPAVQSAAAPLTSKQR